MPETSELNHKVNKILRHVESLDNFMPWLVRHQATDIRAELIKFFTKRTRAAKVFLAIDDQRTISDIAQFTKIARPNVSAEVKMLTDNGLVETSIFGSKTVCRKNKIDKILGLSKELEKLIVTPDSNKISDVMGENKSPVENNDVLMEETEDASGNGDTDSVKNTESNQ